MNVIRENGFSKRKHPERICENNLCKISFIPTDARQKYCSMQCKINFNNDKRNSRISLANQTLLTLKKNEQVLSNLYRTSNSNTIDIKTLIQHGFNFNSYSLPENVVATKKLVNWFLGFGLESTTEKNVLKIIKR